MWCRKCQQDVPAVSSPGGGPGCPRCGERLRAAVSSPVPPQPKETAAAEPSRDDLSPPGLMADDWEADGQLRDIQQRLGINPKAKRGEAAYRREAARFDLGHDKPSGWHPNLKHEQTRETPKREASAGGLSVFAWLALLLGTMAFVCGGSLLGWSLIAGRQELWTVGLPVTLCGQIGLLIGLILQIERLWRDNRRSAAKLETVDAQLHDLKTTTTLMGSSYQSPGTAFYTHLAHGASPELLLTDLKSQIDLLALKMSREKE